MHACRKLLLMLACLVGPVADVSSAAPESGEGPVVSVKVIGGVVIARGELQTPQGQVQGQFVIDLGSLDGLVTAPEQLHRVGIEPRSSVTVTLGPLHLDKVVAVEHERAERLGSITADHAIDLEQIPLLGIIGLGAFSSSSVELDVNAGTLKIMPAVASEPSPVRAVVSWRRGASVPLFEVGGTSFGLSMLQLESLTTAKAAERLKIGQPEAEPATLLQTDLLRSDAFRVVAPAAMPSPDADLAMGVRWLSHYRVTLHPSLQTAGFEFLSAPQAAPAEQRYFFAKERRDATAIASFLEQNPDNRLATEASIELLQDTLQSGAFNAAAIDSTIRTLARSFPAQRRAHRLVALADDVMRTSDAKLTPVVRQMLSVAAESAAEDLDARAIHAIHARQGVLQLHAGNLAEARSLLISAAYGTPGDRQVNQWMGDLYRKTGEPIRAWSRYLDAALSAEGPSAAVLRSLDDVMRDPAFRSAFDLDDAELTLEGRLPAFAPPTTRPATEQAPVRLVELFTDDSGAGCVGPQLAFDGLRRFYARTPVVFIAFHFGPAGNTALASARARFYERKSVPAVVADSDVIGESAGGVADAPSLFDGFLTKVRSREPAAASPEAKIRCDAAWRGQHLETRLELTLPKSIPADAKLRLFGFVCERRTFALGGNGIAMHYASARLALGAIDGMPIDVETKAHSWDFNISENDLLSTESQGDQARASRRPPSPSMRTTAPDPRECYVVFFIQDTVTKRVLAASLVTPDRAKGDR
jgi:hypothetical protein